MRSALLYCEEEGLGIWEIPVKVEGRSVVDCMETADGISVEAADASGLPMIQQNLITAGTCFICPDGTTSPGMSFRPERSEVEGSEGSGSPVGYSAKQKARWSPDARGARDGDTVRGACAFPYRNKQCEALQGEPLMTASGGNIIRGEVNRKRASSPVGSCDH